VNLLKLTLRALLAVLLLAPMGGLNSARPNQKNRSSRNPSRAVLPHPNNLLFNDSSSLCSNRPGAFARRETSYGCSQTMKRLLLASLLLAPVTSWHATAAPRPNIILLLADDMRWDAMSCVAIRFSRRRTWIGLRPAAPGSTTPLSRRRFAA